MNKDHGMATDLSTASSPITRIFSYAFLFRSLLFVSVISLAVWSLHTDIFKVTEIQIENFQSGDSQDLFKFVLPMAREIGQSHLYENIWWLDVNGLALRMNQIPGVRNVVVERRPPSSLKVKLLTEKIMLAYIHNGGDIFPITESGRVLEKMKNSQPDVPLTQEKTIFRNLEMRKRALKLLANLPEQGLLSRASVAEIELDEKSHFWITLTQPALKIKMNPENAHLKAKRVERVLDYTRKHNLHARVIDSNYSKKVVVKLRKDR